MNTALSLFNAIPAGRGDSEQIEFCNFDLHDTYQPDVYTLDGSDYKPRGPLRVVEVRRRKKIRFVRVDFYEWRNTPTGGVIPQKYMSSYAWQGEHALHLLEQPTALDADPFEDADDDLFGPDPDELDATHVRLLSLSGERDWHLDVL